MITMKEQPFFISDANGASACLNNDNTTIQIEVPADKLAYIRGIINRIAIDNKLTYKTL